MQSVAYNGVDRCCCQTPAMRFQSEWRLAKYPSYTSHVARLNQYHPIFRADLTVVLSPRPRWLRLCVTEHFQKGKSIKFCCCKSSLFYNGGAKKCTVQYCCITELYLDEIFIVIVQLLWCCDYLQSSTLTLGYCEYVFMIMMEGYISPSVLCQTL